MWKTKNFSSIFCCIFEISFKFWTFFKKRWPSLLMYFSIFCCIFEISFKFWIFSKKSMTLIPEVFPKLRTQENMVTLISKKSRFEESFGKQHGKRAQTLLKFAWQHLYHIYWSLWMQLTCKGSLLVTWYFEQVKLHDLLSYQL